LPLLHSGGEDQGWVGVHAPRDPFLRPGPGKLPKPEFGYIPKVGAMEFSGNQLRAAHALPAVDQETLAKQIGELSLNFGDGRAGQAAAVMG
jgi:hypothetical protein